MNYDDVIEFIDRNLIKNGRLISVRLSKNSKWYQDNIDFINEIMNHTGANSLQEAIYLIKNKTTVPVCKHCKENKCKFVKYSHGYRDYCSVKCASNAKETKEKIKSTNIKKYGVEHTLQSKSVREKGIQTLKERYGVDNPMRSESIKEKAKKTCIERYGVENAGWTEESIKKIIKTNNERYGVDHFTQVDGYYENLRNILKDRYGVTHSSQVRYKNVDKISPEYREFVLNEFTENGYFDIDRFCDYFNFSKSKFKTHLEKFDIDFRKDILYKNLFKSKEEVLLFRYLIDDLGIDREGIIINDRSLISPYEIDFYLPKYNLAIEINGFYWHSEDKVGKTYHKIKSDMCAERGVLLLHIFDFEINDDRKFSIWKSIIASKLGITKRIYARKCEIRKITDSKVCADFLKENHLQGYVSSKYNYGLYYNDELVAFMNFGKTRFENKDDYELFRYCNKIGYTVIGGFSKLLNNFSNQSDSNIISYANRRWSNGNVYETCGFYMIGYTDPGYFYTDGKTILSRHKAYKGYIKKLYDEGVFKFYDDELSQYDNMLNNGFWRVYDAGHIKYVLRK